MNKLKNEFLRAMHYMKPNTLKFAAGIIVMSLFSASITVIESIMLKYIIDAAIASSLPLLFKGIFLVVITAASILLFMPIFHNLYNKNAKIALANVRRDVFRHRGELPVNYFENHHSGEIISKLLNDTENMSQLYTSRIRRLTFPVIYGTMSAVPMFILNWKISIVLVLINAVSLLLNTIYSKHIRRLSKKIQTVLSVMTENLLNILAGIHVIKLFHLEKIIQKRYEKSNNENTCLLIKRNKLSSMLISTNYLFGIINNLGLLAAGSFLVMKNFTTFGTLFALMTLQKRLNKAFLEIGEYIPEVHSSLAGAEKVFEYLDEPSEPAAYKMENVSNCKNFIEFKDIVFSYENNEILFNNLNFKIKENQTVALVGPSGCGKSSIIKLLLGFYPPQKGTITVNYRSLNNMKLKELRELIAYVPQDAYIYNGTIEENILYGNIRASFEEAVNAAKSANAHAFIMKQTHGYKTIVGERGTKLSGGQRQRIAIARAVLKNSPILLLDEATSSLDTESESLVQEALEKLMKNRTTVIVAHRLSTIEKADNIFVLNNGRIAEQGNHNDLLMNGNLYKTLYNIQFEIN